MKGGLPVAAVKRRAWLVSTEIRPPNSTLYVAISLLYTLSSLFRGLSYAILTESRIDKAQADILDTVLRMESAFNGLAEKLVGTMNSLSGKVDLFERVLVSNVPGAEANLQDAQALQYSRTSVGSVSQGFKTEPMYPSTPSQHTSLERIEGDEGEEEEEDEAGDPVPPGKPSIPVNHTTGAARLLLVGPIAELAAGVIATEKIKNEKYPMIQEEKRGVLRLFGRGEGLDRPPGYEKDPQADYGAESTPSDTNSDISSPAGEEWGQIGGLTPPGDDNSPPIQRGNVIDTEGMPDLRRETVLRYVDSYNRNINNMHPILIPRRLNALVEAFLKSIPSSHARPRQVENLTGHGSNTRGPSASFVGGGSRNPESPGRKRKRSPASTAEGSEVPSQSIWDHKPGHPFRSISTALVLLVMALGEICEHTKKIPDIYPDQIDDQTWASPHMRNGHPVQSSPTISTPTGLPSPQEGGAHSRSRRTSLEGPPFFPKRANPKARNLDLLPGLSYFALATDIIGNQLGGNSLQHVHANILAGLYHGQLGRVLESHTYIYNACRGLQVILRP
jgi:hypothetical protein